MELKLATLTSPILFSLGGYQLMVMPMLTDEAKRAEAERAKVESKLVEPANAAAEAEAVAKETKPKLKRNTKGKEPVAIA